MADVRFRQIGLKALSGESGALLFSGKPIAARAAMTEIAATPWADEKQRNEARHNIRWIDDHVLSVTDWIASEAAAEIRREVGSKSEGLRHTIADQMRPLVDWADCCQPCDERSFPHQQRDNRGCENAVGW